jgi:hypothetical protein
MEKDKLPVNAAGNQINGRVKPGTSGNPKGKPKGAAIRLRWRRLRFCKVKLKN